MSSRAARIVAAAIKEKPVSENDHSTSSFHNVMISDLQPLTTYEYLVSPEGHLQSPEIAENTEHGLISQEDITQSLGLPTLETETNSTISDEELMPNKDLETFETRIEDNNMVSIETFFAEDFVMPLKPIAINNTITDLIGKESVNLLTLESVSVQHRTASNENVLQDTVLGFQMEAEPVTEEIDIIREYEKDHASNELNTEEKSAAEILEVSGKDTGNQDQNNIERKRKNKAKPEEWKRNKNKKLRMAGQQYTGFTRKNTGEIENNTKRPARKLGPPCMCLSKSKCSKFSEGDREEIFSRFWTLTWEQKKMYVRSLAQYIEKKRTYTENESRRTGTILYTLQLANDKLPVCKRMFMSTLGIKERMMRNWLTQPVQHGMPSSKNEKKKTRKQINDKERLEFSKEFINKLPKLPSHYCRRDTRKLYFEQRFKNKTDIYNLYKEECMKYEVEPLSIFSFNQILEELNVAIHYPKKDQCDLCCSHKVGQVEEEIYRQHLLNKNRARAEKENDKIAANEKTCHTLTMDVQAVQLCPVLFASKLYFKSKLQIHNFTIYNIETHRCENYCWNESEGELVSSVFTTCIINYLEKYCLKDPRPSIIIYSDNCGYQNKNVALSNALLSFAVRHETTIFQKYLERGHTQMECDSTHALIQRKIKNREIHLPSQYAVMIKEARQKPFPLDVQYLTHDFFWKYDENYTYSSIRPGRSANDPKVNDVKVFKYSPEGKIFFKLNHDEEYAELPCRQKNAKNDDALPVRKLYENRIKLTRRKFNDLQDLTSVLPLEVKDFYSNLPHNGEDIATTDEKIIKQPEPTKKVAKQIAMHKKTDKKKNILKKAQTRKQNNKKT